MISESTWAQLELGSLEGYCSRDQGKLPEDGRLLPADRALAWQDRARGPERVGSHSLSPAFHLIVGGGPRGAR